MGRNSTPGGPGGAGLNVVTLRMSLRDAISSPDPLTNKATLKKYCLLGNNSVSIALVSPSLDTSNDPLLGLITLFGHSFGSGCPLEKEAKISYGPQNVNKQLTKRKQSAEKCQFWK